MADLHRVNEGLVVWNDAEEVIGVNEGLIAIALVKGQKDLLSEMVQSQWGPVHLFDLCLRCDLLGMALALAAHGVPGCVVEDHHLGPFSRDSSVGQDSCQCQGRDTCRFCSWAFPVDQGIWMDDWSVDLVDWHDEDESESTLGAIPAAHMAAAMPLTRAMLDISSCDMELPFSGSPKAMARLLDIAILTGNQKAAIKLSQKCQLWPLRRWVVNWRSEDCWEAAMTALWAGASFEDLLVKDFHQLGQDIPFAQGLFLESKLEDWHEICHLLPRCHDLWRPSNLDNEFGELFLEHLHGPDGGKKLNAGKIHAAANAGVDLQFFSVEARCLGDGTYAFGTRALVTLLDLAIWSGDPQSAEAVVNAGIELKDDDKTLEWHKRALRGVSLTLLLPGRQVVVVPSDAQTAAAAAGCAALKRSLKNESSQKCVVLFQMMGKMLKGKSVPMLLVREILSYSMPVPEIIDQLDLWARSGDLMAAICG